MKTLKVRVVARAKNDHLACLVDRFGSLEAAAKEVGVSKATFMNWVNFRGQFKGRGGRGTGGLSQERAQQIVCNLERLCGVSVTEIFPGLTKAEMGLLAKPRTAVKEVPLVRLTNAVATKYLTYDPRGDESQLDQLEHSELCERLRKVLHTLSYREREIIKLRYGLGDGYSYTLEEVGHIFKVTRDRIHQIEAKALRKLQEPTRAAELAGFIDTEAVTDDTSPQE